VPLSHAEELKAAQPPAELLVIRGGDHTFGASHPYTENTLPALLLQFCDAAIAFFNK